jgi:hypothetical protein
MFNERSNDQLHIRIQRKRPYLGMKFLKTAGLPEAAVLHGSGCSAGSRQPSCDLDELDELLA